MENIFKTLTTAVIIVVIFIIGYGLYFASQLSAVYLPLKKYNYQLTVLKLQDLILNVDKIDTNLSCIVTDTVGPNDDLAYHMDIIMKGNDFNYSFHIKYEEDKSVWNNSINTEVDLIGAYDSTHNVGGYKLENKGVEKLIGIFDKEFISKIDKKIMDSNPN